MASCAGCPSSSGPPADVTVMPSLTIAVSRRVERGVDVTVKCSAMLPPAGTVRSVQRHVAAAESVPPSPADTNAVWSGTGSLTVTPVASALPTLRTVIV